MERAAREELRRRVDVAVRARILWTLEERCEGCGAELADDFDRPLYVLGCETCSTRRSKRSERETRRELETRQLAFPVAA